MLHASSLWEGYLIASLSFSQGAWVTPIALKNRAIACFGGGYCFEPEVLWGGEMLWVCTRKGSKSRRARAQTGQS